MRWFVFCLMFSFPVMAQNSEIMRSASECGSLLLGIDNQSVQSKIKKNVEETRWPKAGKKMPENLTWQIETATLGRGWKGYVCWAGITTTNDDGESYFEFYFRTEPDDTGKKIFLFVIESESQALGMGIGVNR
jgi:hypothetical protein